MLFDDPFVRHLFDVLRSDGWDKGSARLARESDDVDAPLARDGRRLTIAWIAAERGHAQLAQSLLEIVQPTDETHVWITACEALLALRKGRVQEATSLLSSIDADSTIDGKARTVLNHLRGMLFYQLKRVDEALQIVVAEIGQVARDSFLAARLFDSIGMMFAAQDRFFAAREFFELSLQLKDRFGDDAGQALTHGNLGRLYFHWGMLNQSQEHFQCDLELAESGRDLVGVAVAHNWLGRIEIEMGNWQAARQQLLDAVQLAEQLQSQRLRAFAFKDLALATCQAGDTSAAFEQLGQARQGFEQLGFEPGRVFCDAVEGVIQRVSNDLERSARLLEAAAARFTALEFWVDGAKTWHEAAQTLRQAGAPSAAIVAHLQQAVRLAELARCEYLLRRIEEELQAVDPLKHLELAYRRVRGRNVDEDAVSLVSGQRESTSILFLDMAGSTEYGQGTDPEVVMLEFNQMMSGFAQVLDRYAAVISGYRGDGFMCLFRRDDHANRSVAAALELVDVMEDFNLPRRLLDKAPYAIRIGISTGEVFNGNVGTYAKMDFTSIGSAANLAARLQSHGQPGLPCICSKTQSLVGDRFEFLKDNPREIRAKGFGDAALQVWDVVAQKDHEPGSV